MKKLYMYFTKAEEYLACFALFSIVVLMFLSALLRRVGLPINWAGDVSLLLFTWSCFLGADVAIREKNLVSVDMLLCKLPVRLQKWTRILCQLLAIVFLLSLTLYGVPLCIESVARKFSNMAISYSWATASVPAGALLIGTTSIINLVKMFRSEDGNYSVQTGGSDVC